MVDKAKLELIKFARRELANAERSLKIGDDRTFMQCLDRIDGRMHQVVKMLIAEYYCKASKK